ncbi:MAG: STAS domain-containing protein [Flavobacteriales bacterium]|jgi:anti-anti-sigma factor|uniref:STAS domain-containing protein n=1 Tax=Flavobacterium sp. TaxID=239 RepID=UPI001ACF0D9E|nr:STAS domain-containing protein [Flavobacteriales bacterium]
MALQITEYAGIFEITGKLNTQNANALKNHFETLIQTENHIIISLNQVSEIDPSSFGIIVNLYKKALEKNKVFYILPEENQNVIDLFKSKNMDYMLQKRSA